MTAALAVLGAQAILVTFVIGNRIPLDGFYVVSALGGMALVASLVWGGHGIYD
jgi:hypothetical protein